MDRGKNTPKVELEDPVYNKVIEWYDQYDTQEKQVFTYSEPNWEKQINFYHLIS